MKRGLLRAYLTLFIFYYVIAIGFWLASNELIEQTAKLYEPDIEVNAANALLVAAGLLEKAILNLWYLLGIAIVAALTATLLTVRFLGVRVPRSDEWLGISTNIGVIPKPTWFLLPKNSVELEFADKNQKRFLKLPETHQRVITEVASLLSEYPDVSAGLGHQNSLLDHSLENLSKSLLNEEADPLLPVLAISHDIGKIVTEQIVGNNKPHHDDLSGLIISVLPSFRHLSANDQEVLTLLLKYNHKPRLRPILPDPASEARAEELLTSQKCIDANVTIEEKEHIKSSFDFHLFVEENIHQILGSITYQSYGLPKGTAAGGWRDGSTLYLLENKLREALKNLLPEGFVAAYHQTVFSKAAIQPLSLMLIDLFESKGWLLKQFNGVSARNGLWNIKAGAMLFKAVLVIKLPTEMHVHLPNQSPYEITIDGPTLQAPSKRATPKAAKSSISILDEIKKNRASNNASVIEADEEKRLKNARMISATLGIPL